MKIKRIQLAELWRGNSVYNLVHIKGERSRFIVTKQSPLELDDRTYNIITEFTLSDVMQHWEKLCSDKNINDK